MRRKWMIWVSVIAVLTVVLCAYGASPQKKTPSEKTTRQSKQSTKIVKQNKHIVIIDPGHQGPSATGNAREPNGPGSSVMKASTVSGTTGSSTGIPEYQLNLDIGLALEKALTRRGYTVVMTRQNNDTQISNKARAQFATDHHGEIFVRLHANGVDDSAQHGAFVLVPSAKNPYVANLSADSRRLGKAIIDHYCKATGFKNLGISERDDQTGMNWSTMPVTTLEMGFMTNPSDDRAMADHATRAKMVTGIADGIDAYFKAALTKVIQNQYINPATAKHQKWSVYAKQLTGEKKIVNIHGDKPMQAASCAKLFIMATVYARGVQDGEKPLITRMITQSDNDAANTLLAHLGGGDAHKGLAVVNDWCKQNGYRQTKMGRLFLEENPKADNMTSAKDLSDLLGRIKQGKCVSAKASREMLEVLAAQTRTNKIPAGVKASGKTKTTANKTGEIALGQGTGCIENDAALIYDDKSAYTLVVLSNDLNGDNPAAQQRIVDIAKTVATSWP